MGTLEHTIVVPVWSVLVGFILWAVTNIMIWYATGRRATTIVAQAADEAQAQKREVVAHFDEELGKLGGGEEGVDFKAEIAAVEAHIQAIDNALGAKFEEFDAQVAAMPARVLQALGSSKGVEAKALYKAAEEGEQELETYLADNMSASEVVMARVEAIEPPDDWKRAHPLGEVIVEGAKAWLKERMDAARGGPGGGGVMTLQPVGKKPRGFK